MTYIYVYLRLMPAIKTCTFDVKVLRYAPKFLRQTSRLCFRSTYCTRWL